MTEIFVKQIEDFFVELFEDPNFLYSKDPDPNIPIDNYLIIMLRERGLDGEGLVVRDCSGNVGLGGLAESVLLSLRGRTF